MGDTVAVRLFLSLREVLRHDITNKDRSRVSRDLSGVGLALWRQ
jgi:hypothetical protein